MVTAESKKGTYRSAMEWDQITADWVESGLTYGEYARKHGLSVKNLMRWAARYGRSYRASRQRRLKGNKNTATTTNFLPVHVVETEEMAAPPPVQPGPNASTSDHIEVLLPNGPVVRVKGVVSEKTLEVVLAAASRIEQ